MAKAALRRMGILALGLAVSLPAGAVTAQARHFGHDLVKERDMELATLQVSDIMEVQAGVDVDQALRFLDNGDNSDLAHVGNGAFPDELTFRGRTNSGYGNGGMSWGFNLGMGIDANGSEGLDVEQNNSSTNFYTRQAEVWWWGPFGWWATGWGPGAARFVLRSDLSATDHAQNNDNRRVESVVFRDGVGSTQVTAGDLFRDYQGERSNRLAWYSPYVGGLQGAVSLGNDNESEFLLQYISGVPGSAYGAEDGDAVSSLPGGPAVEAAVGYSRNIGQVGTDLDSKYRLGTSASVLLSSGLNFTVAYGRQDPVEPGIPTNSAWYTKVGQRFGNHAFSVDYGWANRVNDPVFTGDTVKGTRYGVGYQWNKNPYLLYLGFEQYEMNRNAAGAPDPSKVRSLMGGLGVHF
jgi:hypothetical protein